MGSRKHRRDACEIITFAQEQGLFAQNMNWTPQKSLHARLSMDILTKGEQSAFVRTKPGVFSPRSARLILKYEELKRATSHMEKGQDHRRPASLLLYLQAGSERGPSALLSILFPLDGHGMHQLRQRLT